MAAFRALRSLTAIRVTSQVVAAAPISRPTFLALRAYAGGYNSGGGYASRPFRDPLPPAAPSSTLFVGNLSYSTTEEELTALFSEFGATSVRIPIRDDRPMGFSYIDFSSVEAATSALEALAGSSLGGRTLSIDYQRPRQAKGAFPPNPPSKTIFLGNIGPDVTEPDIANILKDLSDRYQVRVALDRETGNNKGFAHVEFESVDEATRVKEALTGLALDGVPVRIDFDRPREPRTGGFGRGNGRGGAGGFGGRY